MEESGSEGLDELIRSETNGFLKDVDATCISDNYWLGTKVRLIFTMLGRRSSDFETTETLLEYDCSGALPSNGSDLKQLTVCEVYPILKSLFKAQQPTCTLEYLAAPFTNP